ncbi:MAG: SpoIIE family protein phosphatase [Acidimicrobiia bacterium]|nr:SpoIIE family protein phosphatase [Acidimicrobiia bacterium]
MASRDEPDVARHLERLEAVTDATLALLDVDAMLTELLDRVVELLVADTAAVLLVDESGEELFARAARGIEEEVRQGVRVPIGHGFAGRIAAERRPIVLDRIDDTTVANPILWEKGIRTMAGVPLISGGAVVGVLHVGSLGSHRFDEEDIQLLRIVADRLAIAVQVRLLEGDRAAAEALQRSLVPSVPHRIGPLEFAARYVPAERGGVGGDWYDVFELDNGDIWVVVGDVVGHGLHAAVVMGRIRSALRSYALMSTSPDEALALTNRKVLHFEVGNMATAAVGVISPPYDEMQLALAGHPPPMVAVPGRATETADIRAGLPLGVSREGARPVASVPLPPGAVVVLYTDGLIERRGEIIDQGLDRLRTVIEPGAPSTVCHRVMAQMIGNTPSEDDVAVLAVRRPG